MIQFTAMFAGRVSGGWSISEPLRLSSVAGMNKLALFSAPPLLVVVAAVEHPHRDRRAGVALVALRPLLALLPRVAGRALEAVRAAADHQTRAHRQHQPHAPSVGASIGDFGTLTGDHVLVGADCGQQLTWDDRSDATTVTWCSSEATEGDGVGIHNSFCLPYTQTGAAYWSGSVGGSITNVCGASTHDNMPITVEFLVR